MSDQQRGKLRDVFAKLEEWPWEALLVVVGALAVIALYFAF
jgi:hypothetical protein